jgi:hypothetical protein
MEYFSKCLVHEAQLGDRSNLIYPIEYVRKKQKDKSKTLKALYVKPGLLGIIRLNQDI